ncbi:hypothetical protein GRX03_04235 [Halovenus sp. WSH3]|uniref:DUF4367 domain-containing protein n=1 Tax=Halovenus carboxidivorans TaxID=2692199 RepID=A0A6B0SYX7_9EURY|nr:hypothetical protein [Halovenus carboxidivorans]MXR50814.1 hypothetical protein [Halovenus carboxidivorans]
MSATDRRRGQTAVLAVSLVAAVAVVTVAGLIFAGSSSQTAEPTADAILDDVEEKYNGADSVVTDAVVTVERGNRTAQFELSVATAGERQARLNISREDRYVLLGTDGETMWIHDPETTLTGVLRTTGDGVAGSLRAGTEQQQSALPGLPISAGEIEPDDQVSELLAEFDGEIPPQYEAALEDLPENATVADLVGDNGTEADLPGEFDRDTVDLGQFSTNDSERLGEFSINDSARFGEFLNNDSSRFGTFSLNDTAQFGNLSAAFGETPWTGNRSADGYEFGGSDGWSHSGDVLWNSTALGGWRDANGTLSAGKLDGSAFREMAWVGQHSGDFEPANATVDAELVGTTTVDGTDAYELRLTGLPEGVDARLWVGVDTDTILKQQFTADETTVTVDVTDTRFDVAAADSTFEPPGAMTVVEGNLSVVGTAAELDGQTPFDAVAPSAEWTFERGYVSTIEAGGFPGFSGMELPDRAVSVYADGNATLVVSQSDAQRPLPDAVVNRSETVTVGDKTVQLYATGDRTAAVWQTRGTRVSVAGDISRSRLESVIGGIDS